MNKHTQQLTLQIKGTDKYTELPGCLKYMHCHIGKSREFWKGVFEQCRDS